MEPIKNALAQAGHLVQQAAHSVVEALRTIEDELIKDNDQKDEQAQVTTVNEENKINEKLATPKSPIVGGGYHDQLPESDAKVLPTSWPDLIGKTLTEAQEIIRAKGYSNIKIMKKGTSSSTEHDESRVILYIDENEIVVEEPRVG